uniref:Uncharacterized protein n=1 Tax=Bracon brevicornis TaxID=1563983 RepID=A0A6V7KE31_9HYME
MPPTDHLGNFFAIVVTVAYHSLWSVLVRVMGSDGCLQRISKRTSQYLTLLRCYAGVDKIGDHVAQNHQVEVSRGTVFFQYAYQFGKHLFDEFVTVTG